MENLTPQIRNAVRAVILRDDRILLLRKSGGEQGERFALPGGAQDLGETLRQALDKVPQTVIIGVEPADIDTQSLELTPPIRAQVDPVIDMVLVELDRLGVSYKKGTADNVSCNPLQNNPH